MLILKKITLILFLGTNLLLNVASEAASCTGNNGYLKYEVGKTYEYSYKSKFLAGSSGIWKEGGKEIPNTMINLIETTVSLRPISECEFILTIDGTQAMLTTETNAEKTEAVKLDNLSSSIKFVMQNGKIETVLSNPAEPAWSVNMKKAIAGMFQNKAFVPEMDKGMDNEQSILGDCVTSYTMKKTQEGEMEFNREIHLDKCGQGEGSDLLLQGTPYQIPLVNNKPIFGFLRSPHDGSIVTCTQKINSTGSPLSSVECHHNDLNHKILGHVENSYLNLISEKSEASESSFNEEISKLIMKSSILYDFTKSISTGNLDMETNAMERVKELLKALNDEAALGRNLAEIFIELKKALKKVSDLKQFNIPDLIKGDIHRKTFYDAAIEVTSDSAIELVSQAALDNQLDEISQLNFFSHIAFASKPGVNALTALKNLVNTINLKQSTDSSTMETLIKNVTLAQHLLLGASGLAHQYCSRTNANCANEPEYIALVDGIAQQAKIGVDEEILRAALHALGNLDALTPEAISAIKTILTTDNSVSIWMEIHALEAFRRDPCQTTLKEVARSSLGNNAKTDEIRIFAYLALSKCLQKDDLQVINNVFGEEKSQVSGFIASHLKNIKDSSSPSKSSLKALLADVIIPETVQSVNTKPRASKFIEHSMFKEKENYGFSAEATIIFHEGNPIPEFVSLNKTIDLFGRSFNFLEIGLSQRTLMRSMQMYGEDEPPQWSSLTRAIPAKDSYYRIFGTTIGIGLERIHQTVQMSIMKLSPEKEGKTSSMIIDLLQPGTIIDEELIYPTLSGLPMSFDLHAAHFKALKLEMTMDQMANIISNLFSPHQEASLDVKMNFKLDSSEIFKGSAGYGVGTPIHIGYQIEGKVEQKYNFGIEATSNNKDGSSIDLKVNFPEKAIATKTINGEISAFKEINGKMMRVGHTENAVRDFGSQIQKCEISKVFGIKHCVKINHGTSGRFPMEFTCSMDKTDSEMIGYNLNIKNIAPKGEPGYHIQRREITLSLPGSSTPREIQLKFGLTQFDNEIQNQEPRRWWMLYELEMETTLENKKFQSQLKLNTSQYDQKFDLEYTMNGKPITKLVDAKLVFAEDDSLTATATFGGPLQKAVQNVNLQYMTHKEVKTLQERSFGKHQIDFQIGSNGIKSPKVSVILKKEFDFDLNEMVLNENPSFTVQSKVQVGHNTFISIIGYNETKFVEEVTFDAGEKFNIMDAQYFFSASVQKLKDNNELSKEMHSIELGYGWKCNFSCSTNLTMDLNTGILRSKSPMRLTVNSDDLNREENNWGIKLEEKGSTMAEAKLKTMYKYNKYEETYLFKGGLQGMVHDMGDFNFNLTNTGMENHLHMDVNYLPEQIHMVADTDIKFDGNVLTEVDKIVFEDRKHKKEYITLSEIKIDMTERTFSTQSTTTDEKKATLVKFMMNAQLAEHLKNGRSSATMSIDESKGGKFSGSMNQTTSFSNDIFKSQFEMEVVPKSETPTVFTWDFIYDGTQNANVNKLQGHISSIKKLTGPSFDIGIVQEISWNNKKDDLEYNLESVTNTSIDGKFAQSSIAKLQWLGDSKLDETNGQVTIRGYLANEKFEDRMNLLTMYKGRKDENMTYDTTFKVVRTETETKKETIVVKGSTTRFISTPRPMDFLFAENGTVTIMGKTNYDWEQVIKFHEKEFIIFEEVKISEDGKQEMKAMYYLDISVEIIEDNNQDKLRLQSNHNLMAQCPLSNLNITLSK